MSPQQTIAHYRIIAKLGEGGMGAVYRATDTKLNRDVAIKVLPEAFAQDAARMQRFEREAQMLAALNHPNIAAIYGIEQGAIVMELVEGEDLKGPVPVETAVAYARQIAIALEAAHEKGIIHRDLKPANIKITPEGTAKLLDFGLAKASDEAVSVMSGAVTMSPTLSLAMTQAGMILGTAAYMSPEQARGKAVDKRADIWAFGVVLFELLTGTALFGGGETASDAMAMVILKDPDWNALPAGTPPRVLRLIERCLRKDPKQRLRDIGEARLILDEAEPEPPAALSTTVAIAPRLSWLPWAMAAVGILGGAAMLLRPKATEPGPGVVRFFLQYPTGTGLPGSPAGAQSVPSPDGRSLAFIARDNTSGIESLWVRPLNAPSAHRMDKTEQANFPFWSPDSQSIAFFTEDKLKRVSVSGGNVQTICDVPKSNAGRIAGDGGAWSQEGYIVFASLSGGPILRVPAVGGVPAPVTTLQKDEMRHSWPQLLPGGRRLLYLAVSREYSQSTIYVQELGSTKRVPVTKNTTHGVWTPPGYLLYVREATLFAQQMDSKTFRLEGEPLAVAQDVVANDTNGRSAFAISQNGVLAYRTATGSRIRQLTWYDRGGKVLGAVGNPGEYNNPTLSPDEKTVAMHIGPFGKLDFWVMDLASGVLTRMTRESNGLISSAPVWSPDSQRVAITQLNGEILGITLASGRPAQLLQGTQTAEDWYPDGRSILCVDQNETGLSVLPLGDGAKLQTILNTPYRKNSFRFSPDGKYVVYVSFESGPAEIYVASFPSFAVKRKVSTNGGMYPVWGNGGKEIFYRSADGVMMNAEIRTGTVVEAGVPRPLFKFGIGTLGNRFAVSADGKRLLLNEVVQKDASSAGEITLVLNWAAEIK